MATRSASTILTLVLIALTAAGVQATVDPIQPGDPFDGICTLDFVFDGANGSVYFGTAGHCVDDGERVSTEGHGGFGTVVYVSDDEGDRLDVALIEVDSDKEDAVEPTVKGHPGTPTGVTQDDGTQIGDRLLMSGYGVGYSTTQATRENRSAVLTFDNRIRYCSEAPVSFGDSGGPIVHAETGQALGVVSRLDPLDCPGTLFGPTVQGFLDQAADDGFDLTLRTV